ncbi:HNH endonuclease signature motif containing protein [Saccharopolyspora shandongensis]|uniref:HNH endonuclease n=1 Tax=Saccharopolyspora shandongensis TaxID=418495 RepID=UPI0034302457
MAKWQGRKGRPWRRVVAQLRATDHTCWLCGHSIDADLPPTHPLSYTVDHVVPRSKGGAPTLDNAKPAHRRCNSRRGNGQARPDVMRTSRAW